MLWSSTYRVLTAWVNAGWDSPADRSDVSNVCLVVSLFLCHALIIIAGFGFTLFAPRSTVEAARPISSSRRLFLSPLENCTQTCKRHRPTKTRWIRPIIAC